MRASRKPKQPDDGEPRLWRFGLALAVSVTAAVTGLAGLAWLAWVLVGLAGYRRHGPPSLKDSVSVVQLVLASVAGAGALVALVVAYRRQKIAEADSVHDRTRVFNERFIAVAAQLGDAQPAVRLAGVHAMAALADDWKNNRQTCVDVLCAYLRLPYDPDPGDTATLVDKAAYKANREVRHTIIRLIRDHLRPGMPKSWQGLNLDFTGVIFDGGDFSFAEFRGGQVYFNNAKFCSGQVSFVGAEFCGAQVDFYTTEFCGGLVYFGSAKFSGGWVSFPNAKFSSGQVDFSGATVSRGLLSFINAEFCGGRVDFTGAEFSGGRVRFGGAEFSSGQVNFNGAKFCGGEVDFLGAWFSSDEVNFDFGRDAVPPGVSLPPDKATETTLS